MQSHVRYLSAWRDHQHEEVDRGPIHEFFPNDLPGAAAPRDRKRDAGKAVSDQNNMELSHGTFGR